MKRCAALVTAGVALAVAAPGVRAQIRGSEAASVTQVIDGTRITIEYSRPVAKGRELFGKLVPWGSPWTGANWATTLETNKDIRVNGREVPAGKYSVWFVPRQGDWTVFLDPNAKLFHFQKPDSTPQQIRMAATPQRAPHAEMLTWTFPVVSGDAATLQMQWGETAIPLQIIVPATRPVVLSAEERAKYVGAFEMTFPEFTGWPATARFEVFEENGKLRGRLPFPIHPGDELTFDMVVAGDGRDGRFSPGLYREGRLFNIEQGGTFEFDMMGGRATVVRIRGIEGTVFGEGRRAS